VTRNVLVVPTGRAVGLTSTCLGLVVALDRAGVRVGFTKPVAQHVTQHVSQHVTRPAGRAPDGDPSPALVRLVSRLRPPPPIPSDRVGALLSDGLVDALMDEVVAVTQSLPVADVVVLEGLVPSADRLSSTRVNVAMAHALDADVLLVADGAGVGGTASVSLGSATRWGPWPTRSRPRPPYRSGERSGVAGCVVNRLRDTSPRAVAALTAALGDHGIALAGLVRFRPELTWPRIADVARELGARTLVAGDDSRRVSEIIVCAQAVPGLLPLLGEGRLLLVPGDRHDVVMAACLAELSGTRLAGLLLTAGVEPDPGVTRLTAAAAASGLPILLVQELTYPTAVRLHDLDPGLPADDGDRAREVAGTVADALDPVWVRSLPEPDRPRRLTPAAFRHHLVGMARDAHARIVLPEGAEPRVVRAAVACAERGFGSGTDVDKVAAATALARARRPGLVIDGPLQYDAAAVASVALSKRPGSPVAGRATVFVFPDLNTGNTTYKAVQRSADVLSIGPMLQGLARPVNDLSRGASVEDIVYTIALTAIQAGLRSGARPPVGTVI